jgi:exopolysaccharide production protein ExoQ
MTWDSHIPGAVDDPWRAPPSRRRPKTPAYTPPARAGLIPKVELETGFAFVVFMVMLFSIQLGTIGAALLAAVTPVYAVLQRRRLWELLAPRALLLLIPLLALLSIAWSEAPKDSAKFAVELTLTVLAALFLAGAKRPRAVLRAMSAAFAIYVAVAIALGHTTAVGNDGGQAFSGLSDGKNLLGDIAASGLLISLGVMITSIQRGRMVWTVAAAAGGLIELYAVLVARSAGAVLGLAFGVATLLGLLLVYRSRAAVRGVLMAFMGICLLVGALSYGWLSNALIQLGADLFDKDTTLTGRTYLWYRADELIHEKPLLGRGFYAFWLQDNTDAEGLWRYAGITSRGGFTFHNTFVEIMVQLGWVGFFVIALTAAIAILVLVARYVKRPTLSLCVWISILAYELVRTPIEAVGIAPFYFSTVLTFAALAAAFGRGEARAEPAAQPQGVAPVRVMAARNATAVVRPGPHRLLSDLSKRQP